MLTKFESKSNRVKGLSFHPIRPWILTSLHNGVIQLWDYRMGTLLDRYDEHDGPVRGVDFHKIQPLIVSGGDDYKIKVWDYKLRRCLFTLLGHLDYIRTVQFHSEYPWIVSASDDQTIRIWNWQSRTCIAVLTGHNHYVMCACFHPKDDMIVSASLDQTVRVWDLTGLRKKTVRGAPSLQEDTMVSRVNTDLFGGTDAVVKYVLEGHERGVNWASFHPSLPLVVSGADDRQVKLWRMNETKAWEVHTMTGHTNNVSCVMFHPKRELIVSNSEDKSIRVWDISQRMGVQTFRRENDRFWILAAHPEQNLLAAGHDSGMIVFKLERERPAYDSFSNFLYHIKDRYLRMFEYHTGRDLPIMSLRRVGQGQGTTLGQGPRFLHYNKFNQAESNILIFSDIDGGSYELLSFSNSESSTGMSEPQDSRRGVCLAAVFIARNRFAVLDKNRQILIKNFQNEITKKLTPPHPTTDGLYFGGTAGSILLRCEDRITLYDQQSRRVTGELLVPRVKYTFWSQDYSKVAFLTKHTIVIATKNLEQLCSTSEAVRIKSGAWNSDNRIFIYSTLNHVKYLLSNGDTGIICTLDVPLYITRAVDKQLFCLDRECKTRILNIDNTEALFKLALEDGKYGEVMHMVRHTRLCGNSIISYLQAKGFPEVALHFVTDNKTKFNLALACGNIEVAMNTAYEIPDETLWHRLGVEALRQGNHQVVEMAYQRTKNFERLSFLYLITGNTEKLKKMLKISERRGDMMSRFHNSLYLGDASERVAVLEASGQISLAYLTAKTHGLLEQAEKLSDLLKSKGLPLPNTLPEASLLQPPTPIIRADNWPLIDLPPAKSKLNAEKAFVYREREKETNKSLQEENPAVGDTWDDDLDLDDLSEKNERKTEKFQDNSDAGAAWGDDNDLDFDLGNDDEDIAFAKAVSMSEQQTTSGSGVENYMIPMAGTPVSSYWCNNSTHAADHAAAGDVEGAMRLLNRQIAVVNFEEMKHLLLALFQGASGSVQGICSVPSDKSFLHRNLTNEKIQMKECLPSLCFKVPHLLEKLKSGYKNFVAAQFLQVKSDFGYILNAIPLTVAESKSESSELKELLEVSREYITAVRIKLASAEQTSPARSMELAAYFTHCNLQPAHLLLALRVAMSSAFKNKNYITAASFAQRLIELPEMSSERNSDLRTKAQKILQKSQSFARNEHDIEYDERTPFLIDCFSLRPIYRGTSHVKCPYCSSAYLQSHNKKICETCKMSEVGVETIGLVTSSIASKH